MEVTKILAEIDAQIEKLQQARELLSGLANVGTKGPGRPRGTKSAKPGTKRKLSPEGRKRIQEAMKRRWAERRKLTGKVAPNGK